MGITDKIRDFIYSLNKPKWNLVMVGIFKNEASGIVEWMDHYIREGVDHFFLIDNGSNDGGSQKVADHFDKNLYTIVPDHKKWAQVGLYNKYFLKYKNRCTWIIICDLDEFIYARNGFHSISSFLKTLPSNVGGIKIPWKMFGSNHLEKQPDSIINSFTRRAIYEGKQNPGMNDTEYSVCKMIVRGKYLKEMGIHDHQISRKSTIVDAAGHEIVANRLNFTPTSETILNKLDLHLNHYALQSKEWFLSVKCTRGSAAAKTSEVRNMDYFLAYNKDSNDIEDTELARKQNKNII